VSREELGWPIVMTPFSQILLTQAVMNVTNPERYAVIPDEAIRYAIGRFGKPNVPIDAKVMERIEIAPQDPGACAPKLPWALSVNCVAGWGAQLSDEELLLAGNDAGRSGRCHAGGTRRHRNTTIRDQGPFTVCWRDLRRIAS